MSNAFAQALTNEFARVANLTHTENGGVAYKSTGNKMLDFFSQAGALRLGRGANAAHGLFINAVKEDPLLATKALFYFRDVRGGQGERETFRVFLIDLLKLHPEIVQKNMHLIPEYGRWDDMYVFVGTSLEDQAFALMRKQFEADLRAMSADRNASISLLGKWLKSENTSSKESRALGKKTREAFGMTPKSYRLALTALRTQISVIEQLLSANAWQSVEYTRVPSQANLKYRKAFKRHDAERYTDFVTKAATGEVKMNATTQFPYEIIHKVLEYTGWGAKNDLGAEYTALEAMWKQQPDYIGVEENSIAVCDVSGSMRGLPMEVSVSIGIYLAERNKGVFHNKFITFTDKPRLHDVGEGRLLDKVKKVMSDVGYNTNVKGVFDALLQTAIRNNLPKEEMVKKVYMISDMEFDGACGRTNETVFNTIAREWKEAGYDLPMLVFWNVASRNNQHPMSIDERGFVSVSGCSPSIFTNLMKCKIASPVDMMLEVLNAERYAAITA